MKIHVANQTLEVFEDTSTPHVVEQISSVLNANSLVFEHLLINGIPSYENIDSQIDVLRNSDADVEVVSITHDRFAAQLAATAVIYLNESTSRLHELGSAFQQGQEKIHWGDFDNFLQGLTWLTDTLDYLEKSTAFNGRGSTLVMMNGSLKNMTNELLGAMESKDWILAGDLIQFECRELYESLISKLGDYATEEGD